MRWRPSEAAPARFPAAVLGLALAALVLASCSGSSEASPPETAAPAVIVPKAVRAASVVPRIGAAMKRRLQAVLADGRARGNRDDVFAKVGDSNTAIPDFLVPIGCGDVVYGQSEEALRPVVERWSATPVPRGWELEGCGASNSFTRVGSAAFPGWRTSDLLRAHTPHPSECRPPDDIALRCELSQVRPSVALVMIGTNDMLHDDGTLDRGALDRFRPELRKLVRTIIDAGVIPVLSTLPPRRHPPASEPLPPLWNEVIIEVAADEQVPLWNYWLDLQDASQFGMSYDWLHPSPAPTGAGDLREEAMDWGFNVRNLGALRTLEKVARIVHDDGPPDP